MTEEAWVRDRSKKLRAITEVADAIHDAVQNERTTKALHQTNERKGVANEAGYEGEVDDWDDLGDL